MDISIVKKNSNDFSFTQEIINEINNLDFKQGALQFQDILTDDNKYDTKKTYIWSAMSAVTDQIGEILYEKILNYIDDVSNIDTCEIKALQSMTQILGTEYSIFSTINSAPLEIQQLINVFSVRHDYLLNSEKICSQLTNYITNEASAAINDNDKNYTLSINELRNKSDGFEKLSVLNYISKSSLDNLISSAYKQVLTENVSESYAVLTDPSPIYKILSTEILCSGFEIPNKYADNIYNKKIEYNIPIEFNPSDIIDEIEAGNAKYEDFSLYEQQILDIEIKRRSEAKYELENKTRYAYYKEAKVKEYFKFIETQYNNLVNTYISAETYKLDSKYLELNQSQVDFSQLLSYDGTSLQINETMIDYIANQLLNITEQIRNIREYLKSHAQRTYMKGTYLLIAYVVNEYLKNNIYPTLNLLSEHIDSDQQFNVDANKLTLTEYIDQTNYNNIKTDIVEDKNDHTLNLEYWKNIGAVGTADSYDSTNIFRPEDKSKLINVKSMSQDQINDFYLNILGNFKNINRLNAADVNHTLYNFLSCVFSTGAENTYLDSHGKVMCELPNTTKTSDPDTYLANRNFTVDLDNYVYEVSAAYVDTYYMLSDYLPAENITIRSQLEDSLSEYKNKLSEVYTGDYLSIFGDISDKHGMISEIRDQVAQINETFNNLTAAFSNVKTSYSIYTGEYVEDTANPYFISDLNRYWQSALYEFNFESNTIRNQLNSQCNSYSLQYISLNSQLINYIANTKCISIPKLKSLNATTSQLQINIDFNEQLLCTIIDYSGSDKFENIISKINDKLDKYNQELNNLELQILSQKDLEIDKFFDKDPFTSFNKLSLLLEPYYNDTFNLLSCIDELSSRLDYEKTDWYKYKQTLFYKYSGLSTGDTPYYYIENIKHPSYQIHPCLSNFIEYIDFSYPVKSLAGFTKNTIEYIAKNNYNIQIDSSGYLQNMWDNPLNGNSDYLSKYEKTNHIDELNESNCLYGYDGPFYPKAISDIQTAIDNIESEIENTWYRGLNLSRLQCGNIKTQLTQEKDVINKFISENTGYNFEIVKYGLDIYNNCYTLIKYTSTSNENEVRYSLWIKYKNHPYSFLAFVYDKDNSGHYNYKSISQVSRNSNNSNVYIDTLTSEFKEAVGNSDIYTPNIIDFIFSKDRTQLLLVVKANDKYYPIVNNIRQEYIRNNTIDQYCLYFETDPEIMNSQKEHLRIVNASNVLTGFYTLNQNIGMIYASKINNNNLKIDIDIYRKNNYRNESTYLTKTINFNQDVNISDIKLDVESNGDFSIAYINPSSREFSNDITTIANYTTAYNKTKNSSDETKSFNINNKLNNYIVTEDFNILGNTIVNKNKKYIPYADLGFIPLHETDDDKHNSLSTDLIDDLVNGKILKFELYGNSKDRNSGIDFKYIFPLRAFEQTEMQDIKNNLYFPDNSQTKSTFTSAYIYNKLHYLESKFNKYVLSTEDAQYWDMTETEQTTYLSVDNSTTIFSDYQKLANYNVHQYLSILGDEEMYALKATDDDLIENINSISDDIAYTTTIYMMPYNVLTSNESKLTSYISAYTDSSLPNDTYILSIGNDCALSVSWLKYTLNSKHVIKLDFNTGFFATNNSNIKQYNYRNNHKLFLNLDKPGDSGYLFAYTTDKVKRYCLFIKNISTESKPRFIVKCIKAYIQDNDILTEIINVQTGSTSRRKSKNINVSLPVLAIEGFETKYISFS